MVLRFQPFTVWCDLMVVFYLWVVFRVVTCYRCGLLCLYVWFCFELGLVMCVDWGIPGFYVVVWVKLALLG